MADARPITAETLVALLAPTLGVERATRCIAHATQKTGLTSTSWTHEESEKLLDAVSAIGGVTDVAASHARAVLLLRGARAENDVTPAPTTGVRRRPAAPSKRARHTAWSIAAMLGRTLGDEKALEVVQESVVALQVNEADLSHEDALAVLEHLAGREGMVGVAARFTKTRVLLG